MYIDRRGFWIAYLLILIIISFTVAAIEISPLRAKVNQVSYDHPYTFFLTVINEENLAHGMEMTVGFNSQYLKDDVTFEPKLFRLQPRETKNVKVSFTISDDLPVGEQVLEILPLIDGTIPGQTFMLDFTIEGTPEALLELDSFKVHGENAEEPVYFNVTITNRGNTLEKIAPKFSIYSLDTLVDLRNYEQPVYILPGEQKNFFYFYDPAKLSPGTYRIDGKIPYSTGELRTSAPLILRSSEDSTNPLGAWKANFTLGILSLLALVALLVVSYLIAPRLLYEYKKRALERRLSYLKTRTDTLEAQYQTLLSDVMGFVQKANTELRKQGEQYEIR